MTAPVRAPRHLSEPARRLFADITGTYVLEPHHVQLLIKALESFDRAEQARTEIGKGPLMVTSRLGEPKVHPLLTVERDARAQFFLGIKQLGLDIDGPPSPSTRNRR